MVLPQTVLDGGGDQLILIPRAVGSYGWVTGQLMHPTTGHCLVGSTVDVAFRDCDVRDASQQWQWKASVFTGVLQHRASGQVLERRAALGRGHVIGVAAYRVGSESQRFFLQTCQLDLNSR